MPVEAHKLKDGATLMAFVGDYIGGVIKRTGTYYERDMLKYIKEHIPSGTFVDVGANIGNHTLFFSKYCNSDVIAFEPMRQTFNVLRENVRANKLPNCKLVRAALGDESGEACMMIPNADNIGMARIVKDWKEEEQVTEVVEVTTLDKYLSELLPPVMKPITLIKIDCEGYEPNALRGMLSTIDTYKPVLFVECIDMEAYHKVVAVLSVTGYQAVKVFNATPTHMFVHSSQVTQYG